MDVKTPTQFWTPGGMISTGREEVRVSPEYLRMVAVLAETSAEIELGLHCTRCAQDLVGKNARADTQWIMECACRTFIGANPLPRGN
jgi:hypothetical protein